MKIKVRGWLVISPCTNKRYDRDSFFIGGVAHSAASEVAQEEGGFVLPMDGEFESEQLIQMYQDLVDKYKERVSCETNERRSFRTYPNNADRQAKHVAELMEALQAAEKDLADEIKRYP